jgi:FkbM family methyltransferase
MLKTLLKAHPALWRVARRARQRLAGAVEREMALLPHLAPADRVAVDVGGNAGAYSEQLVRLARSVVTLEANPALATHLEWMFEGRIRVIAAAASDAPGEVVLRIPKDPSFNGLATVAPENPLGDSVEVRIPAVTLDSLDLRDVGFIKIDVEGHEAAVLAGARELLARDRPNLLLEAEERHRPGAVARVRALLEPMGYVGFMLRDGVLASIEGFDPAVHQSLATTSAEELNRGHVPAGYVNNFIFLPR